jgi:hypothetical protein
VPYNSETLRLAEVNLGPVRAAVGEGQTQRGSK